MSIVYSDNLCPPAILKKAKAYRKIFESEVDKPDFAT